MVADGEEGRGGHGCGIPAVGAAPAIEGSGGSTCITGGVSPVWRWLSGDRRWMRCKGGAQGVSRSSLAEEKRAQGGKPGSVAVGAS
jgi:hypothetical protein